MPRPSELGSIKTVLEIDQIKIITKVYKKHADCIIVLNAKLKENN